MGEQKTAVTRSRIVFIIISAFTVGYLIWSLRHFKLGTLVDDLSTINWWWVALAIVSDIAVYACQAWRWSLLLRPVEPVSVWQTFRAVYVGLFSNEVIGFDAGELVRTYVISRVTPLPYSVSLSSALIERIFDGFWLCVALFLALHTVSHTHHLRLLLGSAYALAGVVVIGALLLVAAMAFRHRARALLAGSNWKRHVRVLVDDLSLIGHSRYLYFALAISMLYLALQVLPIFAAFRAYDFDGMGLRDAFATAMFLRLGSAVPQVPGNIGLYLLMKQTLTSVFHQPERYAENFSVVFWGILALRLLIGGIFTITVGTKFGELHKAAHSEREELARSRE